MSSTSFIKALISEIGPNQISIDPEVLLKHGRGLTCLQVKMPDVVVYAETVHDIQAVMRIASAHQIPVTPFAAGTSLEGHVLPVFGGISLNMTRMNRILHVDPLGFTVRVQPGLPYPQLNHALKPHGLFLPIDPGAPATVGGMVATNASGTNSVRYGTMKDHLLAAEVVLASGEVIRVGSAAPKSSSGYALAQLFAGSEGTLGVFSELVLKVVPVPQHNQIARVSFPSIKDAVMCSVQVRQQGLLVSRLELLDAHAVQAINQHSGLTLPVSPMLLLEWENPTGAGSNPMTSQLEAIFRAHHMLDCHISTSDEERTRLWQARHQAGHAVQAMHPHKAIFSTDVAVPLSALTEAIEYAWQEIEQAGLYAPILGHIGDGNFHALITAAPDDPVEWAHAMRVNDSIVSRALELKGTCTGEHGVGWRKRRFMPQEHGPALLVMQAIKKALDPQGILNPGKLIDTVDHWPGTTWTGD